MLSIATPALPEFAVFQARSGSQSATPHILLMTAGHPRRREAETLIKRVYRKAYGAKITTFYPCLLGIVDAQGDFAAVAGLRAADQSPLFCEHYLQSPIEQILHTPRRRIMEIGNLAPANNGQVRRMIRIITAFLQGAGFNQVVFTAVPLLHNAFKRMGLRPEFICAAHQDALPDSIADDWGSYYQLQPAVYCGDIHYGFEVLRLRHVADTERDTALRSGNRFRRHQQC